MITQEERVTTILQRVNPYKAPGPDGLKGRVLKECATTTKVSQLLLNSKSFSQAWKTAAIIPVPKNPHVKTNNYFRPIALTPFLRKCMEHLVRDELSRQVAGSLELMQFAYQNNRGTEDATLTLLNSIYNHQNKCNTHACILFMDSFSALNTVQPHLLLLERFCDLKVISGPVLLIREFLRDQLKRVS